MSNTPIYNLTELDDQANTPYVTVNEMLRATEAHVRVISRTTAAQPASPADGDTYILPASPTGALWGGFAEHDLVLFVGGTWKAYTPIEGWGGTYVNDEGVRVDFNGTIWTESVLKIISVNTTITVAASGADYTTLQLALDSLDGVNISSAATVTIQIADGAYTSADLIDIVHPQSNRIEIVGENTYATTVTSVASSSGSAGAWSVVLNVADSSDMAIGNYLGVRGASGGTNPEDLFGCFEVTAIPSGTQATITVPSHYSSAPSGAVTGTVVIIKTVLNWTADLLGAISIKHGGTLKLIDKLVMVGNSETSTNIGIWPKGTGSGLVTGMAFGISNWGRGVFCNAGSSADINNIFISLCLYGIWAAQNSTVLCSVHSISGCTNGITSDDGGNIKSAGTGVVSGCTTGLLSTSPSSAMKLASQTVAGCTTVGISAIGGGAIQATSVTLARNATDASPAVNSIGNDNSYISTITGSPLTIDSSVHLATNDKYFAGDNDDFEFYHNGSLGVIRNNTGDIYHQEKVNSGLHRFYAYDSAGVDHKVMDLGGSTPLAITYHDDAEAFRSGSGGISFDAGTNVFDHYTAGTAWTPTISFGGATTGITYGSQTALYTKTGDIVTCTGWMTLTSKGTATGNALISGLPFNVKTGQGNYAAATLRYQSVSFADYLQGYGNQGTDTILLQELTNAGVLTNLDDTNFANNSTIMFSFIYRA